MEWSGVATTTDTHRTIRMETTTPKGGLSTGSSTYGTRYPQLTQPSLRWQAITSVQIPHVLTFIRTLSNALDCLVLCVTSLS